MKHRVFLMTLFVLVSAPLLWAQGTITGTVVDSAKSDPLIGANVYLVGTALGSVTNIEGQYRIVGIPEGSYTLRISYIGYRTRNFRIQLTAGETLQRNVRLVSDIAKGISIDVTAQAMGQMAAINQQISAKTIVNVVSEEKIQELPDANAAESIGRLPGVSLLRSGGEANKIVLRGLSDKFTAISIDGVRIAPTDADARGVDLSTISQGSLAGIELYKALTSDMDADAIAGGVNMVTKKGPGVMTARTDIKGSYNSLDNDYEQYDISLRLGKRVFNNVLGIQVSGNLERRDRSTEYENSNYDLYQDSGKIWEYSEFAVNYTDELRERQGLGLLFDINTPEGGSVRLNTIFSQTNRNFIHYDRNYPTDSDPVFYTARDREQDISTFSNFLSGENYLLGLRADWSFSLSKSHSDYPYDYELSFTEPSSTDAAGNPVSGMKPIPDDLLQGPPERFIPYALNNFERAYLYTAYYRGETNDDLEKTAFLNLSRKYTLGKRLTGEIKIGGKYRERSRDRALSELLSPYYNEPYPQYIRDENGNIIAKDAVGTRFENLQTMGTKILVTNFLDPQPESRDIYGKYSLYPLINQDALREWWTLNRRGYTDQAGKDPEYEKNAEPEALYYDINERVTAGYAMNSLNIVRAVTFISGVRIESEDNDYSSRFSPYDLSGFPVPKGVIKDTTAAHTESILLPNFHLTYRPFGFMNIRFAAYKALARPDFNHRLENFIARRQGTFYSGNSLQIGNPNLKAAKAWNFEANTSLFDSEYGLFTVSAFYKDIKDMFHLMDSLPLKGQTVLDSLGIRYKNPWPNLDCELTFPFNSTRPTRVWGFEVEHQANLQFLPGLLRNITLSYNASIVRSETYIPSTKLVEYTVTVPGLPFPVKKSKAVIIENKQKLEGQPEFFGNAALGYDIRGFSTRLSVFHQGEYNRTFSPDSRSDNVQTSFTRWDLAFKQQVSHNIAILLNVNNLTNVKEGRAIRNRTQYWYLSDTGDIYGLTADLGIRLTL